MGSKIFLRDTAWKVSKVSLMSGLFKLSVLLPSSIFFFMFLIFCTFWLTWYLDCPLEWLTGNCPVSASRCKTVKRKWNLLYGDERFTMKNYVLYSTVLNIIRGVYKLNHDESFTSCCEMIWFYNINEVESCYLLSGL